MDETQKKAEEDLRIRTLIANELSHSQFERTGERNRSIAVNVLNEEIGTFGPYDKRYDFDQATRDVLLAHGRQDAAHALVAVISLSQRVERIARRLVFLIGLSTAVILAAIWWAVA